MKRKAEQIVQIRYDDRSAAQSSSQVSSFKTLDVVPVLRVEIEVLDRRHVLVFSQVDLVAMGCPRPKLQLARLPIQRPKTQFLMGRGKFNSFVK